MSAEFASWSAMDQAVLCALIDAQTAAGEGVALTGTEIIEIDFTADPVTEPAINTLSIVPADNNSLIEGGAPWAAIKFDAMVFGFNN